jgi:hypothetical protein
VTRVSQTLDRIDATFDDPKLVANAGFLLVATLSQRLGLEALSDATVRLEGRVGGARPRPPPHRVAPRRSPVGRLGDFRARLCPRLALASHRG